MIKFDKRDADAQAHTGSRIKPNCFSYSDIFDFELNFPRAVDYDEISM